MLATSGNFPTSQIASGGTVIPVTWTLSTEGNKFYETTSTVGQLRTKSRVVPAGKENVIGIWVEVIEGSSVRDRSLFTWRHSSGGVFCNPDNANCRFNFEMNGNSRETKCLTRSNNYTFPANITVKLYEAVI